ncbi:MAG: L-threonylcarbamoyladenylate synthase [Ruminococcus flavefaciens]|nr:L-threonylcarbamoyladenylate synthase [Ruminococcus flavefaciens]
MNTLILPVNKNSLAMAKKIISDGGAVAFPTETVYGLGANAFDTCAVENIFKIKGRPNDNPLIVHVHSDYDILRLVSEVPDYAKKLAKEFLPGPLTMVYKSRGNVSSAVSCGLDTLAIRVPANADTQKFLKFVDLPIAAPSANISKHISPVAAEHVFADLNGKIALILDGGKSEGGIESTVLDCTGEIPVVLRSGLVTKEMIASVVGACEEYVFKDGERARSPGMKYKHYSPDCETMLFGYSEREKAAKAYDEYGSDGVYILCDDSTARYFGGRNILNLGSTEREIASNLYSKLREGEKKAQLIIAVAPEKRDGIMVGVMNRLSKACRSK